MAEHIDPNCYDEVDAFVDLLDFLRVPYSRDTNLFCIRAIEKLSELVNRFVALQPSDTNFDRYLSAILTHSKAFLTFFETQLAATSNVGSEGSDYCGMDEASNSFLKFFMEEVYRPFFDKLSQCVDMRKVGVDAVRFFELMSRSKFFGEGREMFCDAAAQADDRYVVALGEQIKFRCSQLSRSVYEEKANIDVLTNVYSRRRTFELLQVIFDEYFDNDDIANVGLGSADSDCDGHCDEDGHEDVAYNFGTELDNNPMSDYSGGLVDCEVDSEPVESKSLAVVFIDLDHFKRVNDDFDHEIGDKVLKIVGKVLKKSVRINDIVGRFGGEEFVLVLDDVTLEDVVSICDRLMKSIDESVREECPELAHIGLTASVGIAIFGMNSSVKTASDLVNVGDVATYAIKKTGRNGMAYIRNGKLYRITNVVIRSGGGCSFDEKEIVVPVEDGSVIQDNCVVTFVDDDVEFTVKIENRKIVSVSTRDIPKVKVAIKDSGEWGDGLMI